MSGLTPTKARQTLQCINENRGLHQTVVMHFWRFSPNLNNFTPYRKLWDVTTCSNRNQVKLIIKLFTKKTIHCFHGKNENSSFLGNHFNFNVKYQYRLESFFKKLGWAEKKIQFGFHYCLLSLKLTRHFDVVYCRPLLKE